MQLYLIMGMTYVALLKLTCFILGYFIVKIGAGLLRDGIAGEFKFNAELHGAKADLVSASPGLLFLLLGTVLIGYAMWVPKPTEYQISSNTVENLAPSGVDTRGKNGAPESAPVVEIPKQ